MKTLETTGLHFLFACRFQVLSQCRGVESPSAPRLIMEIPVFKTLLC